MTILKQGFVFKPKTGLCALSAFLCCTKGIGMYYPFED